MQMAEALIDQGRLEDAREACQQSLSLAERSAKPPYLAKRKQELEALDCL